MTDARPDHRRSRPLRVARRAATYAVVLAVLLASSPHSARSATITFDETPELAPATYADAVPGGPFGPHLEFEGVSFDGGMIGLAITPSDQAATTLPNFYVTTDFLPLADGSLLPGLITAVFATPVSSVALDVGNGNLFAAEFILTAFSGSDAVATDTIALDAFASLTDFVGHLEVNAPNITSIIVTSDQPAGSKLFSVDTVSFLTVPEPASGLLALFGLSAIGLARRRPAFKAQSQMRGRS